MTDRSAAAGWPLVLSGIARATGHELRNALNALVVNLEVVRSQASSLDASVRPFVTQSVLQAEESVNVAEATIALLNLVVSAIDERGAVRAREVDGGVRIDAGSAEVYRIEHALQGLVSRHAITADVADTAVILRVPDKARHHESK